MESTKLTTRTYTAPTCTLNVTTKAAVLPNLPQLAKPHAIDFTLHLDSPEQGESGRITLAGNPQQLNLLQQSVSKYVAELVAKFPLQTPTSNSVESAQHPNEPDVSVADRLYAAPGAQSIEPNLTPAAPDQIETPTNLLSTKHISKLLGLSTPESRNGDRQQAANIESTTLEQLHLTGGDNNLDHKLHLGNLATANSGQVLTLSAIQLFDLSTILDEYVAEVAAPKLTGILAPTPIVPAKKTTDLKTSTPDKQANPLVLDTLDTSDIFVAENTPLSRLPNLPKIPTKLRENSQVYDYADTGSRSPFLSVIPWAAAAVVAVGIPLVLFGSKSNSLKDLTSNVKLPDGKAIESAKQSVLSRLPGQEKPPAASETDPDAKTSGTTPKPWEPQLVQAPPGKTNSAIPGTQLSGRPDKIGIAPLPPAIGTQAQAPAGEATSNIAPNPLRTPSIPATIATTPEIVKSTQSPVSTPVTTIPVRPVKIATAPAAKQPAINKFNPSKNGSIGMPPKVSVGSPSPAYGTQVPFTPPMIAGDGINPTPVKPTVQKKAAPPKKIAVKPKKAGVSKPSSSPLMAPQPIVEPFTQSPNPNIITPIPPTSSEGSDVQNLPIIPEIPVQSNIGPTSANPDPFDSPALKETKVYFQSKWQADPNQPNPLQYVVSLNSKTGVVRSVKPQNEAATTYLKKSGLIKPGQKLVSPTATGTSEQKIRVLLQPTGDVDAFMEP